ncbi:MAG TPA: Nudix family hydrolase [Acidiferrobacterales bacterium]|nr:Nudix family hydrolase [Acidiferrobacterales bacterium]
MPSTAPDATAVAVGIVENAQHQVLVAQRPGHKHQGGKWEFPGGKIHAGEAVPEALTRELHEELGITLRAACPLQRLHHAYPDQSVLLDVWRVTDYTGDPHGREGQPLRWVTPQELASLDLPAADLPIVRALQLPTLYLITDARRYGKAGMLVLIERALTAGARLLQLREPYMSAEEYTEYARVVTALAHRYDARVLLNADPALVAACNADGVHLNNRRLMALQNRPLPQSCLVAVSCHDANELAQAARIGADFALLSPVLPTASHPHAVPLGWEGFLRLRMHSDVPVYALGGMLPEHLTKARCMGASGLAMIRGLWEAPSIEQAVEVTLR